jgi:hypothetical protein
MALLRVQARQLLNRLQGVCATADAAITGTPLIAGRSCTTLAAADGAINIKAAQNSSEACCAVTEPIGMLCRRSDHQRHGHCQHGAA